MMPGPEEFRRDIRAAKRFGLAQGLLLLPSLFSLILAIAFAVDGSWRETAMAVGVCVLLAGVLVCLECKEKRLRRESTQYYTFPLPRAFDYETVCTAIETASGVQWTYLCDETARICRIEGVFSWRVALLYHQHGGGGRSPAVAACPRRGRGFPLAEPLFLQRRPDLVAAVPRFT